jgi:5-methylthioadenosine/S-adenosylhomocysteine deaminase
MVTLILRNALVVPMTRDGECFCGDIAIAGDRIHGISRGRWEGQANADELDLSDMAVLPGFIQGHVHVVQSLLRHQADHLALLDWLRLRTWPYEAALDSDGVRAAAELGIAELLSGGTTTVLDFGTTHHHDRVFEAAEELGIRMISGKTHMDVGDDGSAALIEDTDRSLAEAETLGRRWHNAAGGRLKYAVAPRFALSCSRRLLESSAELARRHGWLIQSHAAENRDEIAAVEHLTGLSNIEYLDSVGLTGADCVLAHGVHLNDREVELLAETGTRVCHCPGANLKLGSGIADVPRLIRSGVVMSLGADGAPCNNRLSILQEMYLAATLHNLRHGPSALPAWQALALATRDAAVALHLEREIGTLEVSKIADLVAIELSDWSLLPEGDVASRIVFGATAATVRHVIVAGRVVVKNRTLVSADPRIIRDHVHDAWTATRSRMTQSGVAPPGEAHGLVRGSS